MDRAEALIIKSFTDNLILSLSEFICFLNLRGGGEGGGGGGEGGRGGGEGYKEMKQREDEKQRLKSLKSIRGYEDYGSILTRSL